MRVKILGGRDRGQALLIVLLVMAVALVLVLSIVSRSITDISETARDEESFRAFSAAEAGVEQALITGLSSGTDVSVGNATYSVDVGQLSGGAEYFNHPSAILSGNTVHVWFVGEDDDGSYVCDASHECFNGQTMTIGWGKGAGVGYKPAIEVIVYYEETGGVIKKPKADFSGVKVARAVYDPMAGRTAGVVNSSDGSETIGDVEYDYSADIDFGSLGIGCWDTDGCLLNATVRMLYNTDKAHPVGFSVTGQTLASQGIKLKSVGSVGDVSRAVEVFRLRPEIPSLFEVGLYSGGSIVK